MPQFRISGVRKSNNVITHYAFHTITQTGTTRASKTSKVQAIALLETPDNSATTWVWNYNQATWNVGEPVQVINGPQGKYLI